MMCVDMVEDLMVEDLERGCLVSSLGNNVREGDRSKLQ